VFNIYRLLSFEYALKPVDANLFMQSMQKIVALIDLDYFYAQCEELRAPNLKGLPLVIVMPSIRENSGVVATCNYEARALKIRSGMPLSLAKQLANQHTTFINADKLHYEEIAQRVFEIVDFNCDKIEQVSIDEAYLDLTNPEGFDKAINICNKIKQTIFSELNLTCSIGISNSKFLAKMSSGIKKPGGFTIVKPEEVEHFLSKQRVSELPGTGPKAEEIFSRKHIHFVHDIKKHEIRELIEWFGDARGTQFYNFAFGIDEREVLPNREKQQLSRMITLEHNTNDFDSVWKSVDMLCDLVYREILKLNKKFRTVSLIIVNEKIETITRSKTRVERITSIEELRDIERVLLRDFLNESISNVRRVGVKVSNFDEDSGMQKKLFEFK